MATPAPPLKKKIVKQVLTGDQVVLIDTPQGGPPPEKILGFSNIAAPKLGRLARGDIPEAKDEPYAWEAREFLRKKLVGGEVSFQVDAAGGSANRDYGVVYFGKDNESITDLLLAEGLAKVRDGRPSEERNRLLEIQERAKDSLKGIWNESEAQKHVRDIKGAPENLTRFVETHDKKPVKAIIEHVRDGATIRAVLLPDFHYVTLMITGIRCPAIKTMDNGQVDKDAPDYSLAEEAKFFVEHRLLQRDIDVILDMGSNTGFYATILHPKGNIAEVLLREGYAQCVDWSISALKPAAAERLRAAESHAKENRTRRWKSYEPKQPQLTGKEKEFSGTVVEVVNGDALMIKVGQGDVRKIFLSSIRPPRDVKPAEESKEAAAPKPKIVRPLYDIPWLFDAREFLRKKMIGKKVTVTVDYKQPAQEKLPEKVCCTVKIGGINVAEALVMKGLATVVRHGQNDDSRSSCYDTLKAADEKARKSGKGMHAKNTPTLRVTDVSSDAARAKTFLSSLQRSGRVEAIVEFIASGSRLRLYIPKEACLATFLLAGVSCPRASRTNVPSGVSAPAGEPFGDDALVFTRDRCMQREVEIKVDYIDKAGNFIGWLFVEGVNLAVALVEEGLASVHFSAEKTEYFRALKAAEDAAKARRIMIWKNYVEEDAQPEEKIEEETTVERKVDYQTVVVTEATSELKIYAQVVDQGPKLEALMASIRQEFQSNPPLPGAYTPRKGDLCAAKFSDDEWYRARVERIQGGKVHVFYIDYGNREVTSATRCASLPGSFTTDKPYASEFTLAFVKLPSDTDYHSEAIRVFQEDIIGRVLLLNVEYKIEKTIYASVACSSTKADIGKSLVSDGYLMVDPRREKRLQKVVAEYRAAQEEAKKQHKEIWQYGDITEDDAKEFGLSR